MNTSKPLECLPVAPSNIM